MKTIEIELPLTLGQQIMTSNRTFSNIKKIEVTIKNDLSINFNSLRFDTDKVIRYGLNDIIKPNEFVNKKIKINPKFIFNDEVLFLNNGYNTLGTLKKEKVTEILTNISYYSNLFWYKTETKSLSNTEIYSDINDFINRTKPKNSLGINEKYIFTNYCIEQNKLVNVQVEKVSETHFKITKGYNSGQIIRGSYLYNSHQSFINKMTCSLDK